MNYQEWTHNQRRVFIDAAQVYEAYTNAFRDSRAYRGGMHWKRSGGRQYLFRSLDREGNGKSLGPRSPKTEHIYAEFHRRKSEIAARMTSLRERLAEQSRFCKAVRIGRVSRTAAAVLRLLDQQGLLGGNVWVAGTHSLFAYEARAGIFLDRPLMATADIDRLWDTRPRLKLLGNQKIQDGGLMGILKKADRTFEPMRKRAFRAVNRDGFMVDLIKTAPPRILDIDPLCWGDANDLQAAEIRNLHWLVSAPKFSQVVIGEDGFPAPLIASDPRAFVMHKLWLADQPDREPIKKQRDRAQAHAVAQLVIRYLPDHPFGPSNLRMFPREVVASALQDVAQNDLPPGFESDQA